MLIKVAAAPVNPSDLSFLQGNYGIKKKLPAAPGLVGSGTVVASGSGLLGRYLTGKRVAFAALTSGHGSWADYALASVRQCIPLARSTSFADGANLIVNPMTVLGFFEIIKKQKSKAVIHTAAASSLGLMFLRESLVRGLEVIHIVRRKEQVEHLRSLGAAHVLDSSAGDFERQLRVLAGRLKADLAFDAIAGEMTRQLMQNMPARSRVVVYGGLSEQACQIHPGDLIFRDCVLEGFWLSAWMVKLPFYRLLQLTREVQQKETLITEVAHRVGLDDAVAAIEAYQRTMTGQKVLIEPGH